MSLATPKQVAHTYIHAHSDTHDANTVHANIDERTDMCCLCIISHLYINTHTHSYRSSTFSWPGLALCVCGCWGLHPSAPCVCVICLRQATALKGARLQTLHWDETPATGLRPEPWRTNTHRWRGHSYHGQSRHSITAQAVWHSGVFVLF